MQIRSERIVIVGGGPAGLLSAYLARDHFEDVYVVEKSARCGGLVASYESEGMAFDYGTHVLGETGIEELDEIILGVIDLNEWNKIGNLATGSYFKGRYSPNSCFVNSTFLEKEQYEKAIADFQRIQPPVPETLYSSCSDFLNKNFGPGFLEYLFKPILKKLYGTTPDRLDCLAHRLFGLNRIIAFSPAESRKLKETDHYDSVLGFHSYLEGQSDRHTYYPKAGGVGQWVDGMLAELESSRGVHILTNSSIEAVKLDTGGAVVTEVTLASNEKLCCDQLIWTIPPQPFQVMTGMHRPEPNVSFRRVLLLNYIFDRAFETDVHFIMNFDDRHEGFRITLYPNMNVPGANGDRHHCTVEVLTEPDRSYDSAEMLEKVHHELVEMTVVSRDAGLLHSGEGKANSGFPVMYIDYHTELAGTVDCLEERFANVQFLGKASGRCFFLNDAFCEVYHRLRALGTPPKAMHSQSPYESYDV